MRLLLAWVRGGADSGCAELVEQEIAQAGPVSTLFQHFLGVGGEVMMAAGEYERAIALFGRALDAYQEPNVGYYLPEIWRLRGKCLLAVDRANQDEARRAFQSARSIARRQGAVIFERRVEASLAAVAQA
jgi:tetratricopeptide (TPR) repeat protein